MKYTPLLLLILLFACNEPDHQQAEAGSRADTTIVSYSAVKHGSFDSSNCVTYDISIGGRSTGFSCTACQRIGGFFQGRVDVMLPGKYNRPVSYRKELRYLQQLLPHITKRFPKDSLDCIALYGIADHPDLAIKLTKEFEQQFGTLDQWPGQKDAYGFLDTSVITKDFNRLLAPYSIKVKRVSVEKLSMASGTRNLLDKESMEYDTAQIPKKVLDGTLWIYVR